MIETRQLQRPSLGAVILLACLLGTVSSPQVSAQVSPPGIDAPPTAGPSRDNADSSGKPDKGGRDSAASQDKADSNPDTNGDRSDQNANSPHATSADLPAFQNNADSAGRPSGYLGPAPSQETEDYFELLKLFADTLDQVERNYVEPISRRELLEAAIQGVLSKLDQYSDYIPPEQFDNFRTGVENQFGGIGIRVGMIDGQLTVITPLYDTPAYHGGILKDDKILSINGTSTEAMTLEKAIGKMKGPLGSELTLRVKHANDVEEQVTLKRELVQMETVLGDKRTANDQWNFLYDEENKVGYIRIKSFSGQTAEDLKAAMQKLTQRGLQGLILDLRFNPGGMLTSAIEVTDTFLEEGTIVSTSGRNVSDRSWSATEPGTFQGFKMVVLVNRYSASASEIVAAALQDHQRAIVIGERTWGKASVQNIIEMEGGRSALKLTTANYMRPSGKNIDRPEDSTENDDWGVRPNDGFQIRMTTDEMRRLMQYQGEREILTAPDEQPTHEPYVDRHLKAALDYLTTQ